MTVRLANLPIVAVMGGTTFVAVTAFVLAYDGSRGAATDAGIAQAGWYPFCIEGVIVCASVATLRLRRRVYPWLILLVFSGVSVAANVLHAWEQPGWMWWSLAFAAVPPLALPICVHLLLMVGRGGAPAALGGTVRGTSRGESDPRAGDTSQAGESEPDPLLLVGQAVAADVHKRGERLTRRRLIDGIRERGHTVSTTRATELLNRLRDAA